MKIPGWKERPPAKQEEAKPGRGTPPAGGLIPPGSLNTFFWIMLSMLLFMTAVDYFRARSIIELSYSDFKTALGEGRVVECVLRKELIRGTMRPEAGTEASSAATTEEGLVRFRVVRVEDPGLVDALVAAGVKTTGVRENPFVQQLLSWLLPLALLLLFASFMMRRVGMGGSALANFGKSRARVRADEDTGVTFQDVAGCVEAKQELEEVVEFLKTPERYRALGAHVPKGVLLTGPPGTGKTLLARAVAGEAAVPFYSLSGSDFVEMFVGVGAARVRDLFEQAKGNSPCIIFIDELDAVGRMRSVHGGMTNDEREHTLNQLLVELDGFEPNSGVILLAATNRPDVLDPALLRAGRFDRQVVLDSPDLEGRDAILRVHAREKPLAKDTDLRAMAKMTVGFSGADLANAINEAALLAVRRRHTTISQDDLLDAVERVVAGPERKSRRLSELEKVRVANHEAGHALVATSCSDADPVHKISIVPRGRAALGYTLQLPSGDRHLYTRAELLDRVRGLLGGRAAEEVVLEDVSTGAENDLEHATMLVRQIVCLYGMGESVGLAHLAQPSSGQYLGAPGGGFIRDCSDETSRLVDEEVQQILDFCYEDAKRVLLARRPLLDRIVKELLGVETLEGERLNALLAGLHGVEKSTKEASETARVDA